jgi:hypothetical protein
MGIILGDENDVNTVPCNSAIPNLTFLEAPRGLTPAQIFRKHVNIAQK